MFSKVKYLGNAVGKPKALHTRVSIAMAEAVQVMCSYEQAVIRYALRVWDLIQSVLWNMDRLQDSYWERVDTVGK